VSNRFTRFNIVDFDVLVEKLLFDT